MVSEQENAREGSLDRRMPCQVSFDTGEKTYSGASTHFSEKGMLVLCKNPAPLNVKGRVTLGFPGFKNAVELAGEVVWTNVHGTGDALSPRGMGIKFSNVERDTERLLLELSAQYESLGSLYACFYT